MSLREEEATHPRARGAPQRLSARALLALLLLLGVALTLRLVGLTEHAMGHPENFAPGLAMPDWVRFPPPRHDVEGVLKGTLIDGHPPTYFLMLLAWIEVVGSSVGSLRALSALLGTATVGLTWLVARREGAGGYAALAAGLLALHGFHLFWSQMARMYVPAAFLAAASTVLLLRLRDRPRTAEACAYVLTTAAALWTHLYVWPLVFAQMVVATAWAVRWRRADLVRAQLLAVLLASCVVQLAIFQNPPSRWRESFLDYLACGYLFDPRTFFFGPRPDLRVLRALAAVVALLLVGAALLRARVPFPADRAAPRPWRASWTVAGAVATTGLLAGFAGYTIRGYGASPRAMGATIAIPAVLTGLAFVAERAVAVAGRSGRVVRVAEKLSALPPSVVLATLPPLVMLAVSQVRGVLVARGTIVFLPFLAVALAHGVAALPRGVARRVALVLLVGLHLASVPFGSLAQSSPRDYRGLARALVENVQPDEPVMVRNDFMHPPLLYYMPELHDQLVWRRHAEVTAPGSGVDRVWLVRFDSQHPAPAIEAALQGWVEVRSVYRHGGGAALLRRGVPTAADLPASRQPVPTAR